MVLNITCSVYKVVSETSLSSYHTQIQWQETIINMHVIQYLVQYNGEFSCA